jgi:hypothetical protein
MKQFQGSYDHSMSLYMILLSVENIAILGSRSKSEVF